MSISFHKAGLSLPRVKGPEEMLSLVREVGIIPFFENSIEGFSVEEMTPSSNWFDSDQPISNTPWDWKIYLVQSGEIAYGKFLGGKAAFATVEWYAHLRAWRLSQEKYLPDVQQQAVIDFMAGKGSVGIKDIRGLLGIKKGRADALMQRLQMGCRAITGDIVRVFRGPDLHYNGWQTSSFCSPEAFFDFTLPPFAQSETASFPPGFSGLPGLDATSPYTLSNPVYPSLGPTPPIPFDAASPLETGCTPGESYERLFEHIRSLNPSAPERLVARLLG